MKSLNNVSNNQISESLSCLSSIKMILSKDYSHVDIINPKILQLINSEIARITKESNKREDEF